MQTEERKTTINSSMVKTDFTEAVCVVCIFLTCILCAGEPDLLDAIIANLLRT